MRELNQLDSDIKAIDEKTQQLEDNIELIILGEMENDEAVIQDAELALGELKETLGKAEIETLLCGEADENNCYVEVHAGAGGTEAQDWAEMLIRMYSRWADSKKFQIDSLEESPGEEAGLKSATLKISGQHAYGWLKTESGVHRLVRISPYDSSSRRHTSFSSVWVFPEVRENIQIVIEEKDLRVDTYRASGAGGQHVNKPDSAVRITHLPTGIVVQCQNDRSQHKNRSSAMSMLKSRLYEAELQRKEEKTQAEHDAKTDIGWGHQIRSYILQPYQLVKDMRTDIEISNTQGVLNGEIDIFIEAALAKKIGVKKNNLDG